MRCYVCEREILPRKRYCDRCRVFIHLRGQHLKHRAALKEAYDRRSDGFRCHWSGVLLEERDRWDPFHLVFDHLIPVRRSVVVASSALFNGMKTELGPDEFKRAVRELAAHHAGKPFDRDCIKFRYWGLRAPSPHAPGRHTPQERPRIVVVPECVICGRPPTRWSYYCPRCRALLQASTGTPRLRAKALKEAWDPDRECFACHYTGARLDETDPKSPWYLNFEHAIPRDRGTLVVAAYWVNLMKTSLSEKEFWAVVLEYDRYLREGGEFDRDIVAFKYWRRRGKPIP